VVADGGHADTIDHCPARPAAESDWRDHAIQMKSALVSLLAPMSRRLRQNQQQQQFDLFFLPYAFTMGMML